jgi:ABC-2 type transport system permease protein
VLAKLMVTPTPRAALIAGKGFAAGVRSIVQAAVIVVLSAVLGVAMTTNPLNLLGVAVIVVLGSAFFSCLSMSIAGVALSRDRLMGIGQAITMPLFFSSNALYPERLMPGWLQAISKVNLLSYEVSALRGLLIAVPTNLALDAGVLTGATVAGITVASLLLPASHAELPVARRSSRRRPDREVAGQPQLMIM